MQKWEYLVVNIHVENSVRVWLATLNGETALKAKGNNRPHINTYEPELYEQLGQEGWELVSTSQGHRAYFKRPRE